MYFFLHFSKFWSKSGQISAACESPNINKNSEFGTNIGFNEYLHMLCRLQLFVDTIARSLMPWWLVGACCSGHMVLLHCWSGGHGGLKWPQFATDKYLLHTCNTVVYNWCGSLKILFFNNIVNIYPHATNLTPFTGLCEIIVSLHE